jgi:membrane associated rhomboid family serine protease
MVERQDEQLAVVAERHLNLIPPLPFAGSSLALDARPGLREAASMIGAVSSGADLFVVCKSCGSEVSPYITECPYCGARLRKRAPKLDREGAIKEPRASRQSRARARAPRAARSISMPSIRLGVRPWGAILLALASVGFTGAWRAGAFSSADVVVVGQLGDEPWRVLTAPFLYFSSGYQVVALGSILLFGWLLERRHGPAASLFVGVLGGSAGMLLAVATESFPVAAGGNGAALALLAAWAVPDLYALRRREETDSDLLGVAAIAVVLLLIPLAATEADWVVGVGGALVGLAAGVPLARLARD